MFVKTAKVNIKSVKVTKTVISSEIVFRFSSGIKNLLIDPVFFQIGIFMIQFFQIGIMYRINANHSLFLKFKEVC